MLPRRRIQVLFCIDIEPEERKLDEHAPSDWLGFEKSFEFFAELRSQLAKITRSAVHFSWFARMDPQIAKTYGSHDWVVSRYRHVFERLLKAGDEIGLHSHAWRWDDETRDWFVDLGDPEWIDHCISSAFEAFHSSLNRRCRSFRFGDHWMSERGLDQLEKLGARFDLTLEPGQAQSTLLPGERHTGTFPDCRVMPQVPYRPDVNDFTKPGHGRKRNLWLIPVGADRARPPGNHLEVDASGHENEPYVPLNLAFDRSIFSSIAERLLVRTKNPILVIVARTDVAVDPQQRVNLEQNIEFLMRHPLASRFSCVTPAEAIKRLRFHPLQWLRRQT